MRKIIVGVAVFLIAVGFLPLAGATNSSPRYRVVELDLGKLPGHDQFVLTGLNNRGQISGWRSPELHGHAAELLGRGHPFLAAKGKASYLPPLEKGDGHALGINDRGDVVGDSNRHPVWIAVLWKAGEAEPVPLAEGDSRADAINNRGDILLHRFGLPQKEGPAIATNRWWLKTGSGEVPISSPDERELTVRDLSDRGEVVGYTLYPGGFVVQYVPDRAFAWRDGRFRWLTTAATTHSGATALNERGEIVGWTGEGEARRACLWTGDRRADLGTLGGPSSAAVAINERGLIVGSADDAQQMSQTCLWQNGKCRALRDLVPRKFAEKLAWIMHVVPDPASGWGSD